MSASGRPRHIQGERGRYFLNFVLIKVKGDKEDEEGNKSCTFSSKIKCCLPLFTLITSLMLYCLVDLI